MGASSPSFEMNGWTVWCVDRRHANQWLYIINVIYDVHYNKLYFSFTISHTHTLWQWACWLSGIKWGSVSWSESHGQNNLGTKQPMLLYIDIMLYVWATANQHAVLVTVLVSAKGGQKCSTEIWQDYNLHRMLRASKLQQKPTCTSSGDQKHMCQVWSQYMWGTDRKRFLVFIEAYRMRTKLLARKWSQCATALNLHSSEIPAGVHFHRLHKKKKQSEWASIQKQTPYPVCFASLSWLKINSRSQSWRIANFEHFV